MLNYKINLIKIQLENFLKSISENRRHSSKRNAKVCIESVKANFNTFVSKVASVA